MGVLRYGRNDNFDTSVSLKEDGEFVRYEDYKLLVDHAKKVCDFEYHILICDGYDGHDLYVCIKNLETLLKDI